MKIGELAELSGFSTATIRFYEKKGIIAKPRRLASGYRDYDGESLKQLQLIKFGQELGFSLDEMSAIKGKEHNIDREATKQQLLQKQKDIDNLINQLQEKKRSLDTLILRLNESWSQDRCVTNNELGEIISGQTETLEE